MPYSRRERSERDERIKALEQVAEEAEQKAEKACEVKQNPSIVGKRRKLKRRER